MLAVELSCRVGNGGQVARPGFIGRREAAEPVGTAMVWPPRALETTRVGVAARAPSPPGSRLRFCEPRLPVSVRSGEDLGSLSKRNGAPRGTPAFCAICHLCDCHLKRAKPTSPVTLPLHHPLIGVGPTVGAGPGDSLWVEVNYQLPLRGTRTLVLRTFYSVSAVA